MAERSFWSRHGLTLIIVLPVSLFVGLMLATAGVAVFPSMAFVAKPLICSGELTVESQNYSYRPGQSGVTRTFWCETGEAGGKPAREEVTFRAIGASFLVYSAIVFVLLRFLVAPLLRRRLRAALQARVGRGASLVGAPPGTRTDLQSILSQVAEAVKRGDARVNVRSMGFSVPPDGPSDEGPSAGGPADDDPAERLAQLKRLYEQGLITAADYEAKKAEILSGL